MPKVTCDVEARETHRAEGSSSSGTATTADPPREGGKRDADDADEWTEVGVRRRFRAKMAEPSTVERAAPAMDTAPPVDVVVDVPRPRRRLRGNVRY